MENKIAKIPVASHGLHKHNYNYPWLSSINFGDVMPCYYNPIRKGERDNPNAGLFSQLMPIAHNAFATGRFNFKAIFVPYKLVWRPWYAFDQQTIFNSNGQSFRPERYPYVTQGAFTSAFIQSFAENAHSSSVYDIAVISNSDPDNVRTYNLTAEGRRLFRVLGALGCVPSFIDDDTHTMNILALLCYIKAFNDYYFPNNYVGNTASMYLEQFAERDTIDFTSEVSALLVALSVCTLNFYENSIFDLAWDNPASPNATNLPQPDVEISDRTVEPSALRTEVNTTATSNDTPIIGDLGKGVLSKFILDTLESVSLWMKRKQLSGARLLDKFLVSRGISLPNDSARISYFIGQRNVEIEVSGVENNTDVNLGELAGRGIASTGDKPLSFDCRPDDDGIFFVIVSPIPDANFPVLFDGFAARQDFLDNYTAEYDKLNGAPIPTAVVTRSTSAVMNHLVDPTGDRVFGFLNQYWDEVQEKPRLLGDFILDSKGAPELRAYHTFRILSQRNASLAQHSFDFIRMEDASQFQRLFYNDEQENLMLFLRWYGSQYKEKLPLGDSYDWDDDELNRKVSVVVGGSQK